MPMIKVGIAGVPLALKGKGTAQGIKYLAAIGLDALEVQFVRRVSMKEATAVSVGEIARAANIHLSVHAPYMVNLASESSRVIEESVNRIKLSLDRGYDLGASIVVFHSAYYAKRYTKDETFDLVKDGCARLLDYINDRDIEGTHLGIELLGRQSQFGTVDEVCRLHRELADIRPVVDFAHLQARCNGCLHTVEDYERVLWKLFRRDDYLHIHFSGIEFSKGNERRHLPVDIEQFKLLASALKESACNATVICESPLLEKDALKMKQFVK
jgi:deoxyribonuclease-4